MQIFQIRATHFVVILSLVSPLSCGNSPTDPGSPGIQPQIINSPDSFEYQVSNIENYSGADTYAWQNSGQTANIDISSTGTSGSAMVYILDAANNPVFSSSLLEDGTFPTETGSEGTWKISVEYDSFTGTVNFRAQTS